MRYAISSALFIMAAFALLGGFEGLIVSGVPRYLAHLTIGTAALIAGYGTPKIRIQDSKRQQQSRTHSGAEMGSRESRARSCCSSRNSGAPMLG